VQDRHGREDNAANVNRTIEPLEIDAGTSGVGCIGGEGIREDALKDLCGRSVCVEGQLLVAMEEGERAKIVEAEDMVSVRMGIKDSVNVTNPEAQRLLPKIRPGIDKNAAQSGAVSISPLDRDGGSEPLVPGIGGGADAAGATQRRHTHGCAAAEEEEAGIDARRQVKTS
jgi:hypothetical protein